MQQNKMWKKKRMKEISEMREEEKNE